VGVYSYRSLTRVNSLVKQIKVPSNSLLGKHSNTQRQFAPCQDYKDAFKISLPPHYRILKGTGSQDELFVQDFAKHFFTCKIFRRLEGPLIGFVLGRSIGLSLKMETELLLKRAFKLKIGDSYLVWTVIARETDEILMKWEYGGLQGTTWFQIPRHENCLIFGSSFPQPSQQEKEYTSIPRKLYLDSRRQLAEDAPMGLRLRSGLVKGVTDIVTGVHVLYSKYLLLSTYNKVIEEEKRKLNL